MVGELEKAAVVKARDKWGQTTLFWHCHMENNSGAAW
jgi:hypothetical protein